MHTTNAAILSFASVATAQQLLSNHFGRAGTNATYDYVVVGGGTAGLAVAYRLAEDGTKTVAVIEAGGFYQTEGGNTSTVPAYCSEYGVFTPESVDTFPLTDWGFLTVPQAGVNNRQLHYGRGKMLGGRYVQICGLQANTDFYQLIRECYDLQSRHHRFVPSLGKCCQRFKLDIRGTSPILC